MVMVMSSRVRWAVQCGADATTAAISTVLPNGCHKERGIITHNPISATTKIINGISNGPQRPKITNTAGSPRVNHNRLPMSHRRRKRSFHSHSQTVLEDK